MYIKTKKTQLGDDCYYFLYVCIWGGGQVEQLEIIKIRSHFLSQSMRNILLRAILYPWVSIVLYLILFALNPPTEIFRIKVAYLAPPPPIQTFLPISKIYNIFS